MVKSRKGSPLVSVFVLAVLAFLGFVGGVLGSILWEQPRLLFAYVMGDTTEIDWMGEAPVLPGVGSPAELPGKPEPVAPVVERLPTPPALEVPPAPQGPRLAIQVGAFESLESAENLARRLRAKHYATYVVPGVQEDRPRWRVRVGPLTHRDAAESLASELKRKEHLPTWILEERSGLAQ